jgi:hypothetical protein
MFTVEPRLPVRYWAELPEVLPKVRPSAVPAPVGEPTTLKAPVVWAPAFAIVPEEMEVEVKSIFTTSDTVEDAPAGFVGTAAGTRANNRAITTTAAIVGR